MEQPAKRRPRCAIQSSSDGSDGSFGEVESDYVPDTGSENDDSAEKEFEQAIAEKVHGGESDGSSYGDEDGDAEAEGNRPQKRPRASEPLSAPALSSTEANLAPSKAERLAAIKREQAELQFEQLLGEPQSAPDLTRPIGVDALRTPETLSVTTVAEEAQSQPNVSLSFASRPLFKTRFVFSFLFSFNLILFIIVFDAYCLLNEYSSTNTFYPTLLFGSFSQRKMQQKTNSF